MSAANENHAYLFLSLLQARVGGSLMRRIPGSDAGRLLERSPSELAREMGLGEKATRAFAVRHNPPAPVSGNGPMGLPSTWWRRSEVQRADIFSFAAGDGS